MTNLTLISPLKGWVGPLDECPDPVFAQRLLGDGLAIDPIGSTLFSPCSAQVISTHHTRHAITLRCSNGAELLIHLGLDTVALGGAGFEVHVADGDLVAAGDRLISFDLDLLASRATSLLTPIILTNGDAFTITRRQQDREIEVGDWLMDIAALQDQAVAATDDAGPTASRTLVIALEHGIHARPAAAIATLAKQFTATIELVSGNKRASAKSPVALMALGLRHRDEVVLNATGADARPALAALVSLIESQLSDDAVAPPVALAASAVPGNGILTGVTAAPGLAIGVAVQMGSRIIPVAAEGAGVTAETRELATAMDIVRSRLNQLADSGLPQQRAIMTAHLALLEDPEIAADAATAINRGVSAGAAWRAALAPQIAALRSLADPRIAARADDLLDLEYQVIGALTGTADAATLPEHAIVLARDLLPSQLMAFDARRIAAICTAGGGPTSHVAIIAAAMNIPAVVAVGAAVLDITNGTTLVLDGDAATLHVAPDEAAVDEARIKLEAHQARRSSARAAADDDCRMADGTRIEVFANLSSVVDAQAAVVAGAEGCGLLRTELLFLDRTTPPDADEQAAQYQAIATTLAGRPLIIRTLDVGGDKPVAYLDIPAEDNPALGLRGVRVGLWQPQLLRTQLTAILRTLPAGQCRIMVPMIASLAELDEVRRMLDHVRATLNIDPPIQLGVMIETPAAAITADLLAAGADFFSIGTNDLAQYTLAMDRGNPLMAPRIDGLHPAVLRLIAQAVRGAATRSRPVGVCGGLASDLVAVPILIGLGVTEISAVPAMIPELKALIRTLHLDDCSALARRALEQASAQAVRALSRKGALR